MSAVARDRCTCHSIRDFTGGHFGSLAMLGVLCGACEAEMAHYEEVDRRENLTPAERDREDIAARWSSACCRVEAIRRRPGAPARPEPPF